MRATLLLAALLLGACATSNIERQIRDVEQAQARAAVAGDRAALEKIFAPGFRLINPSGAIASREELLTLLASGKPPYSAATYVTDSVLVQGKRAAVGTGTESVVFAATGEKQQRRITQVWQRVGGDWQLVLRQATLVAAPPK